MFFLVFADDSDAMTTSRQNALIDGIQRSAVLVAFCDRAYQVSVAIITLFVTWISDYVVMSRLFIMCL